MYGLFVTWQTRGIHFVLSVAIEQVEDVTVYGREAA